MSFFNYRKIEGLDSDVKDRLAGVAETTPSFKKNRPTLLNVIQEASYDPVRGIYCPLNNDVRLPRMLPVPLAHLDINSEAQLPTYFSNPLMLPYGYGLADFDSDNASQPSLRVTNGGFVVATVEHDPKTFDGLNEVLRWTAKSPFDNYG